MSNEAINTAVIGVDPGLECTGWCVIYRRKCVEFGAIKTSSKDYDRSRIFEICDGLYSALVRLQSTGNQISVASVEQYGYQGEHSQSGNAFRLPRLVGAIELMFRSEGLLVTGPSRAQSLTSIFLRPNSKKSAVKVAVSRLVKSFGGVCPSNEHTRDAYAAAWWAVSR